MSTFARSKHEFAALACLVVLAPLALSGCIFSTATPPIVYITPPPGQATLAPGATATPGPATPTITDLLVSSSAADGSWTVTFHQPVVSGIDTALADTMNNTIAARVNSYIADFTGLGLPAVAPGDGPSTLEGAYSIGYNSSSLLSLRFTRLVYVSGAAHPAGTPGSITIDVATGNEFQLTDLFTDANAALAILQTKAQESLSSQLGSELSWPAGPDITFFQKAWVCTTAGLEFTWPQGDLASMAAGMPSATIAWSDLASVVRPEGPAGLFMH
jgi:hypothetical protein